jgi:hypothetical protein
MTYLGSYIDGRSWVWKPEDMSWEQVSSFCMHASGYHVTVEAGQLVWKNVAPWRPDLPENYFAEHKIPLSAEQKYRLAEALAESDPQSWPVSREEFDIQIVPGMFGSTYSPWFRCTFRNGRSFETGKPLWTLKKLELLLLEIMGVSAPHRA